MSVVKLLSRIVAPTDIHYDNMSDSNHNTGGGSVVSGTNANKKSEKAASMSRDHTYGITSDPLTQFACAFSATIDYRASIPGIHLPKQKRCRTKLG